MNGKPTYDCEALWRVYLQHPDEKSLHALFNASYKFLLSYGDKLTLDRNKTKDAIQEVFLNLWLYRGKISEDTKAVAYLLRSIRNEIARIERKRKKNSRLTLDASAFLFYPHELQSNALDKNDKRVILKALNSLPPRQREILYFRFYRNIAYKEIAEILGITYQSAVNQSYRAFCKLRTVEALKKSSIYSL